MVVGVAANAVAKSTTLVNDTDYKVIIYDHDGTRTLAPGTQQGNKLVRGFTIDLEIVNGKKAHRVSSFDYSGKDKVYMSDVFEHVIANWG